MRTRVFVALLAGVALACAGPPSTPTSPASIGVPIHVTSSQHDGQPDGVPHNFGTHLTGDAERPTPNNSRAQGQAVFQLSADGSSLHFRLNVANIVNVTQAHIHRGPITGTGGVVAWLYPSGPPATLIPGRTQGTLGEGTISAASLVGSLAGMSLSALIAEMEAGNAYVNVHTSQFPPGEIRGQIN